MTLTPRMADSVAPWEIPARFRQKPNGIAAYIDGQYAWPRSYLRAFPRHVTISVTGIPGAAAYARIQDVEHEDATDADAPLFLETRARLGHDDGEIYCDRSTVPGVLAACEGRVPEPWWWIATLDNHPWTPAELAADILAVEHVQISKERILAVQCYPGGAYDQSLCYGQTWSS